MTPDQVVIAARFNGPPGTANGGYACGVVAGAIGPDATVRLMHPPPLGVPLTRRRDEDGVVRLLAGQTTIAEGRVGRPAVETPPSPSPAEAARAAGRAPEHHPFPTCFVCGPLRRDDGLGILPGPVGVNGLLACPWRPGADLASDGVVDPRFVWAALDCPSGFACMPPGTRAVLASMTATIDGTLEPGSEYVVSAWPTGGEGRKHRAGSAIHDAQGRRVALAETLWITPRA
jgi:hypothetical protein